MTIVGISGDDGKRRATALNCLAIGRTLIRDGRSDAAVDVLSIARDLAPENWTIVCALADAHIRLGRTEEAVSLWRFAAATAPDPELARLRVHQRLARTALASGATGEAIDHLGRHAQLDPSDAACIDQLLFLRLSSCPLDALRSVAEAHVSEFGRSPLVEVAVALYAGSPEDLNASAARICADHSVFAGQRDLALMAVDTLVERGESEQAIEFLTALEGLFPGDSRFVQRRIKALAASGADKRAIVEAADSLVRRGAGDVGDRLAKMRLLADAGDWKSVVEEAQSVFEAERVNLDVATLAIRGYVALERDEDVNRLLARCAGEAGDHSPETELRLARLEIAAKRPDAAARRLAPLYADPATRRDVRADHATAVALTGDYAAAWPLFAEGLDQSAGNVEFRREAARCGAALAVAADASARFPDALFHEALRIRPGVVGAPARDVVVISTSTLAAGGAERQVALTASHVADRRGGASRTILLGRDFTPSRGNAVMLNLARSPHLEIEDTTTVSAAAAFRSSCADKTVDREILRLIGAFPDDLFREIAKLYARFREIRPSVVHLWQDGRIVVGSVAALLAGVPRLVVSVRNVAPRQSDRRRYRPYLDTVYRALAKRPEVVFTANAEAGGADYERAYGLEPGSIVILRNGVDVAAIRANAPAGTVAGLRERLGVADGRKLVGGVFRLAPAKRPALWLDVARRVAQKDPEVRFLIVGAGLLRDELEAACRGSILADRLVFAGAQSPVEPWIAAMDAMLLVSEVEGLPNVVLEAQSLGVPVIATDAGGTREAIVEGRTGTLVREESAENLAAAVLEVLDPDGPLKDARSLGPAFIEERFGVRRMVDETLAVYDLQPDGSPRRPLT